MRTQDAGDVVKGALAIDPYALNYRVELDPAAALDFLTCADAEANVEQEKVTDLVLAINARAPKLADGSAFHLYDVGREGSRVLYVKFYKNYAPKMMFGDWRELEFDLKKLARQYDADEVETVTDSSDTTELKIRIWWD